MENKKQTILELCSLAVFKDGWDELWSRASRLCRDNGLSLGIQAHNSTPGGLLEKIASMENRPPLSLHAPIHSGTIINLAMKDPSTSFESLSRTADWMRKNGVSFAVFHGFLMTDEPIRNFIAGEVSYEESFGKIKRPELLVDEKSDKNNFFYGSPEWRERMERLKTNLARVRREFPDLTFSVENDLAVVGSGMVLPEHAEELDGHPLCLDAGHLWAACGIHGRDFMNELRRMLASCNVAAAHLHANPLPADTPPRLWRDGHQSLTVPNSMRMPEIIRLCAKAGVRRFTLEISSPKIEDVEYFIANWKQTEKDPANETAPSYC